MKEQEQEYFTEDPQEKINNYVNMIESCIDRQSFNINEEEFKGEDDSGAD